MKIFEFFKKNHLNILFFYCIVAVAFFFRIFPVLNSHIFADDIFLTRGLSDAFAFLWSFWWIDTALLHLENIFHSDWIYPPNGANMFFHTMPILQSFLFFPVTRMFGHIVSFNLMVISSLTLNAFIYYLFLKKCFKFKTIPSFAGGFFFGFSYYFLTKMMGHINMINGWVWGTALFVLFNSYTQRNFRIRNGILFSLFFWMTLWASFSEFFMLIVVVILVVFVFELFELIKHKKVLFIKEKIIFFIPLLLGAVNLGIMAFAPDLHTADTDIIDNFSMQEFIKFPRLSILGNYFGYSGMSEFWAMYYPFTVLILIFPGIIFWKIEKKSHGFLLLALSAFLFVVVLNPLRIPSTIIRLLPMGKGFRLFPRFFPMLMFFSLPFAVFSLSMVGKIKYRTLKYSTIIIYSGLAFFELYPFNLKPSPIKKIEINEALLSGIDENKRLLVIPIDRFREVHNTYQVQLGVKAVQFHHLSREEGETAKRFQIFPHLYENPIGAYDVSELIREMKNSGVSYILFEDKLHFLKNFLDVKTIAEFNDSLLVEVDWNKSKKENIFISSFKGGLGGTAFLSQCQENMHVFEINYQLSDDNVRSMQIGCRSNDKKSSGNSLMPRIGRDRSENFKISCEDGSKLNGIYGHSERFVKNIAGICNSEKREFVTGDKRENFQLECPDKYYLNGFYGYVGSLIDGLGIICMKEKISQQ